MWSPTQNVGLIGLDVLAFIGHKQTNKHQNKQTNRQAKFINRYIIKPVSTIMYFRPFFVSYIKNMYQN